jgi:hypothetical protein
LLRRVNGNSVGTTGFRPVSLGSLLMSMIRRSKLHHASRALHTSLLGARVVAGARLLASCTAFLLASCAARLSPMIDYAALKSQRQAEFFADGNVLPSTPSR